MRTKAPTELVLIQEISTVWSKASRGGLLAGARARIPEVLDLPSEPPAPLRLQSRYRQRIVELPADDKPGAMPIFYHNIGYGETNQFAAPESSGWLRLECRLPEPTILQLWAHEPPLELTRTENALSFEFHWEQIPGKPRRNRRPESVALTIGRWARIRYNLRLASDDYDRSSWFYEKYVLNIGYAATTDPAFFQRTAPLRVISDMADLLW